MSDPKFEVPRKQNQAGSNNNTGRVLKNSDNTGRVLKNSESTQNFVIRKNYAVAKGNPSVSGNDSRHSEPRPKSKSKSKGRKKPRIDQNFIDHDLPMQPKEFPDSRSRGTKRPIQSPEENSYIFKKPKKSAPFINGATPAFGTEPLRRLDYVYGDMQPGPKKLGNPKPLGHPKQTSAYLQSIRTGSEKMKEKLVHAPAQKKLLTKERSSSGYDNFDHSNYLMNRPYSIIPDSMGGSGLFYSEWIPDSARNRPSPNSRKIINKFNKT
jgi:hypothetical protein